MTPSERAAQLVADLPHLSREKATYLARGFPALSYDELRWVARIAMRMNGGWDVLLDLARIAKVAVQRDRDENARKESL